MIGETEAMTAPAPRADAYQTLQALVADDLARVNGLIADRMRSDHSPLIPQLADYLISAGGKRIRPIITLAAAQLCGYRGDHHVRLAATVELIHSATLLHDDVVDESARRRGKPSANVVHGSKPCILVGDYLFSRAFQLMVETESLKVLEILSNASAVIAEGEVLQLSTSGDLSSTDAAYMQVIHGKTAALFAAAAEVGGVIAGAPSGQSAALREYGEALGIAFQLADDWLDYAGADAALGKDVGDDFREGKATLPVLLAYQPGDADEQAFWRRVIETGQQSDGDLQEALSLMTRHGALDETRARAERHVARACEALNGFPDGDLRRALNSVAEFAVSRGY